MMDAHQKKKKLRANSYYSKLVYADLSLPLYNLAPKPAVASDPQSPARKRATTYVTVDLRATRELREKIERAERAKGERL